MIALADFEELIEEPCTQLQKLLDATKAELSDKQGINVDQLHGVELLGEVTRTTKFRDIIGEAFECGADNMKRTMNSQEAVVKGATAFAAKLSGDLQEQLPFEIQPIISSTLQLNKKNKKHRPKIARIQEYIALEQ